MKLATESSNSIVRPDLEFAPGQEGRPIGLREIVYSLSPVVCAVAVALVGVQRAGEELAANSFANSHRLIRRVDLGTSLIIVLKALIRRGEKYDALRRPFRLLVRRIRNIAPIRDTSHLNGSIRPNLLSLRFPLRAALVLREVAALPISVIGEIMDCKADEVRKMLLSARQSL